MTSRTDSYADACLAVARAEGQLDAIEDDLFRFSRTLEGSDDLRFFNQIDHGLAFALAILDKGLQWRRRL